MSRITIKLSELGSQFAALGPGLAKATRLGCIRGAYRAVSTLQFATGEAGPANPGLKGEGGAFNTGHYKRSWKAQALPDGARVYNSAPYAGVIERGRRIGGFPPLKQISRWAQRRLGLSAKDAQRAAFPIARAIARRGLMARNIMKLSLPQIEYDFREEVLAELNRALALGGRP